MFTRIAIGDEAELSQERRSDFDVTNTVRVSSVSQTSAAVRHLFEQQYPSTPSDSLWIAFHDFHQLFNGNMPGYHAVDTSFHDIQHTLDMTLALARLIVGYENSVTKDNRLGPERAFFAIACALFHDAGYIRHRERDSHAVNGAIFTTTHVTRSGRFLEAYLPKIGLEDFVDTVSRVVHYTGYEIPLDEIELDDPRDEMAGYLLGTADLLAQMADRCYLEKCRDRLYPEFVLGEVAVNLEATGSHAMYQSGQDLLHKTIDFYQQSAHKRLQGSFRHAYRYLEKVFENDLNPYMMFIDKNMAFVEKIRKDGDWKALRRRPPCIMPDPNGEARVMTLALGRLREISNIERQNSRRLKVLDMSQFQ